MEPIDEQAHARARLEVLDAVAIAVERRAELIDLVGRSGSAEEAHMRLRTQWGLSDIEAMAVLDLQVRRFAAGQRDRIHEERAMMQRLADGSRDD